MPRPYRQPRPAPPPPSPLDDLAREYVAALRRREDAGRRHEADPTDATSSSLNDAIGDLHGARESVVVALRRAPGLRHRWSGWRLAIDGAGVFHCCRGSGTAPLRGGIGIAEGWDREPDGVDREGGRS